MSFDSAIRHEKQEPTATHAASSDLFNRIDQGFPLKLANAQGGGLEPGGPGSPTGPIEPPPTKPTTDINNTTNNHINNIARGGNADATSTSRANAAARSDSHSTSSSTSRVGDVTSTSTGSNYTSKSVFTAPPSLGGGECTMGLSGGALGFALGGQLPNMDCIREKTGAQKDGQLLDFSVNSGVAAANTLDQALANVDKALQLNKQGDRGVAGAHMDGANAQRAISGHLATESVTAAQKVLGPDAPTNGAGSWNADILNDRTPPAPQPAPEVRVVIPRQISHRPAEHHIVKVKADCDDKK